VFASDALSSSAYATEEILLALMLASTLAFHYSLPIALGIVALLAIVVTSYRQTVLAYPTGGGAFIVAKDNLGPVPGTIAGASLLLDYILTVSVSVAAGVAAITSAMPGLRESAVPLAVACVVLVAVANLRGVRESGLLFAIPSYGFIGCMFALIAVAAWKVLSGAPVEPVRYPAEASGAAINAFLILRAFASGCAALTGVEAISNGVQAFRAPEGKNAAVTLVWLAGLLGFIFLGITFFANYWHLVPIHNGETIVSQLARTVFGHGLFYHAIQAATAAILILAANTSFAGFPRLTAILAKERFLPRQLGNIGDRLVYNNGILILAFFSILLLVAFRASVHGLIPLYAIGVFLSFTLSQAGMVRRWWRRRHEFRGFAWLRPALVNGIGAVATAVVLVVIAVTKFWAGDPIRLPVVGWEIHLGAWIVVLVIPLLVLAFFKIHRHYDRMAVALSMEGYIAPPPLRHTVLVLVNTVHRGIMPALHYARSMGDDVRGVYCEIHPEKTPEVQKKWAQWVPDLPLVTLSSPYRSLTGPVLRYLDEVQAEREDDIVTVLLPEFDPPSFWGKLLHNQSGLRLKFALLGKTGVVVTNIRYHLGSCPATHIPSHLFQEPPPEAAGDAAASAPGVSAGPAARGAAASRPRGG
jgi:amino acid transporter